MSLRKRDAKNVAEVKKALADKYTRKALNSGSRPAQAKFLRQAEKYRQQAANIERSL